MAIYSHHTNSIRWNIENIALRLRWNIAYTIAQATLFYPQRQLPFAHDSLRMKTQLAHTATYTRWNFIRHWRIDKIFWLLSDGKYSNHIYQSNIPKFINSIFDEYFTAVHTIWARNKFCFRQFRCGWSVVVRAVAYTFFSHFSVNAYYDYYNHTIAT